MFARLVWVAITWVAALLGLAAAILWPHPPRPPRPPAANALARSINATQPTPGRRWLWTVTSATSALRTMVVNVEAFNVEDARSIAETIVEPRRTQFDEILVYVHRVGGSGQLAPRRIEWSPRDGYVERRYGDR